MAGCVLAVDSIGGHPVSAFDADPIELGSIDIGHIPVVFTTVGDCTFSDAELGSFTLLEEHEGYSVRTEPVRDGGDRQATAVLTFTEKPGEPVDVHIGLDVAAVDTHVSMAEQTFGLDFREHRGVEFLLGLLAVVVFVVVVLGLALRTAFRSHRAAN